MAIHHSIPSMLQESLVEKLLVAKYCIEYRKDPKIWGSQGCLGYSALVELLSIVDTIGSFVIGGKVRKHFDILNNNQYFNLNLTSNDIDIIYKKFRCLCTHNSVLGLDCVLDISNVRGIVFEYQNGKPFLYLEPLYTEIKKAVFNFLGNAKSVVYQSKQLQKIINT